jgi:hypothetical protein
MSSRLLSLAAGMVTMLIAGATVACPASAMKSADKGTSSSAQTAMVR